MRISSFVLVALSSLASVVAACSDDAAPAAPIANAGGSASGGESGASGGVAQAGQAGSGGGTSGAGGYAGAAGSGPIEASPPIVCGAEFPGVELEPGLVEGPTGYENKLGSVDISDVPDPFDFRNESPVIVAVIRYMLGDTTKTSVSHAEALEKGQMHLAVLAAAAKTKDKGASGKVDVQLLRQGLHFFYPCTQQPPQTLAELKALYGDYTQWDEEFIACGAPKDGPRRLWENGDIGVFVAETVVRDDVRETEVIFDRLRADGQLTFAVYTPEGQLTDRSTFATNGGDEIVLAAPFTCMSCHIDIDTGKYDVKRPEGTGAGCK